VKDTEEGTVIEQSFQMVKIAPEPLTAEAFAEFGKVVGPEKIELTSTEFPFFTNVTTFQPASQPITYLNRHHDHNQIFATFDGKPMVVVVAAPRLTGAELRPANVRAFVTDGNTAIVFHVDTWHLAPRGLGDEPVRALNVQAINNHVHTERVELGPTFGYQVQLDVPTKAELLERIGASRERIESLVARRREADVTRPGPDGWSVKDHLVHVTIWEESLLALLEGRDRDAAIGLEPSGGEVPSDVDAINARIHEKHRNRPYGDVLGKFRANDARVLDAVDKLSDSDLLRPYSYYQPGADEIRPVVGWINGNTWEHYDEHVKEMEKLLT
jgi:ureidoglycolate hydrolase